MSFKERMAYHFEYIYIYECLLGTLACWVFQLLSWISSGHVRFEETKLSVHLKEHQDIFTEVVGNDPFLSSFILKELFNFVFCLQNTTSSVFSTFENVYLLLATLKVFSDDNSFSLLMFSANCLGELAMLVSSTKWYALEYFRYEWRSLI